MAALNGAPGGLLGSRAVPNMNGMPVASMTALALQNHEILQSLATPANGKQLEAEGHMTLRTKVVEEDDDPISTIVAAKTAAILSGSKSPEITDETGVSRKPRKGTPVKLCHTPPAKSIPAEGSQSSRQVFPEMSACSSANDSSEDDSKVDKVTEEDENDSAKDIGNFNIGTMKIPIHKPSKESPRAILKCASNVSPSLSKKTESENTKEDIIEAVANSNAEDALTKVETLRLNDKQYEIVPLGNKQWITRNEYEIMKDLSAVEKPSAFVREKSVATLKVPVFKVNRITSDNAEIKPEKHSVSKRTIDEVENEDSESGIKKQKKNVEDSTEGTPEESDSQDESDAMVINTDIFKETQGGINQKDVEETVQKPKDSAKDPQDKNEIEVSSSTENKWTDEEEQNEEVGESR